MYCTGAELQQRYGSKVESWVREIPAESQEQAVSAACNDASAEIDGYLLLARVKLPLNPVPAFVVGYAVDMAAYLLMMRAGLLSQTDDAESVIIQRAQKAQTFFEKWASGGFDSGDKDGTPNPGTKRVKSRSQRHLDLRGY